MTDAPTAVEPESTPEAASEASPGNTPDAAPESTPEAAPGDSEHRPEAPRGGRRSRAGLWITLGTAACLLLGVAAHQFVSAWLYDQALPQWVAVTDDERDAYDGLAQQADRSQSPVLRAIDLSAVLTPEFVTAERSEQLASQTELLRGAVGDALETSEPEFVDFGLPESAPAWDRYLAVARMVDLAPERIDLAREHRAARDDLVDASKALEGAIGGVFEDAYAHAEAQLAANASASHRVKFDLQHLIAWADNGAAQTAGDFSSLVRAVGDVRTAHEAAEARKLDPGQAVRLDIEAFARSISYGVSLDFAWAYEVAGVTSDSWIAGTAEFWGTDGGWGHITLSDSVADTWDEINARALVAHEVGHTQVVREVCAAIFESPVFGSDHEMWATAWSIGMGYDVSGSGIGAYGRPSPEQIAASQGCR